MALVNTLKNLFLLAVVGVCVLIVLKTIKGGTIATPDPTPTILTQVTECGAADDPCVINGRHYNLLLPEGKGPFPVFLFFHGSYSNGNKIVAQNLIVGPALARGYAVIAPTALEIEYSESRPGTGWITDGREGPRDDYRFTRNVIADAEKRFPIDTSRILTVGHSNGATFVWYFACAATDFRQRAFATIGGTMFKYVYAPCDNLRPRFSLMHTHGTSDRIMPYMGRTGSLAGNGKLGAVASVELLINAAKCQDSEDITIGKFEITQWSRCLTQDQFGVALYDGGHNVPKGWTDFVLDWYEGL